MKRTILTLTATIAILATTTLADTSITGYGTYWDAESSGAGVGVRLKKTFLGFGAAEVRGGYVNFDDIKTDMIPLDISINARLPFMISPYAGVGAGYYFMDSDIPGFDNSTGYFAQLGVEATFVMIGVMAEIRYNDLEGSYFDGASYNAGILFKW
jgi:opacity protein-like surface antigen